MKCGQEKSSQQCMGPGQSLLKFMDMASDTVKCAMSKPTNFKKNINHRRYLQRQVKSFVKSGRTKTNSCSPKKTPSSNLRDDVQHLVREAIKELRSSYTGKAHEGNHARWTTVLPVPSHLGITCSARLNTTYRLTHLPNEKPCTMNHQDFPAHSVPKIEPKESHELLPCFALSCSHDAAQDDMFMSGEELTNNIDINDLYIPELHEPKSPIVNCEDYFMENDLEIPSPLYDSPAETECSNFHFEFDCRQLNQRIPKCKEFL